MGGITFRPADSVSLFPVSVPVGSLSLLPAPVPSCLLSLFPVPEDCTSRFPAPDTAGSVSLNMSLQFIYPCCLHLSLKVLYPCCLHLSLQVLYPCCLNLSLQMLYPCTCPCRFFNPIPCTCPCRFCLPIPCTCPCRFFLPIPCTCPCRFSEISRGSPLGKSSPAPGSLSSYRSVRWEGGNYRNISGKLHIIYLANYISIWQTTNPLWYPQ